MYKNGCSDSLVSKLCPFDYCKKKKSCIHHNPVTVNSGVQLFIIYILVHAITHSEFSQDNVSGTRMSVPPFLESDPPHCLGKWALLAELLFTIQISLSHFCRRSPNDLFCNGHLCSGWLGLTCFMYVSSGARQFESSHYLLIYGPCREKTRLRGLRQSEFQTSLLGN